MPSLKSKESMNKLLQEHFGAKKVYLHRLRHPRGPVRSIEDVLTRSAYNAVCSLIQLFYQLERLVGRNSVKAKDAHQHILAHFYSETAGAGIDPDNLGHTDLESLVTGLCGVKRVFLSKPYKYSDDYTEYFTQAGGKAYGKFINLVYDMENVFGEDVIDANMVVDELDSIIAEKC